MKTAVLEKMTWLEAEKTLKRGLVVLTPLGARLKEHGPHLPLNNDWVLAERLASLVAARCPVLLAPTLPHLYYPSFVEYPGSVNIGLETSTSYLLDYGRSLARHGARRQYILNTGISTLRPLAAARQELSKEGIELRYTNLHDALDAVEKTVRESEGGTHADEIETSMMLYLAPGIVKMSRARKDYDGRGRAGGLTRDPMASQGVYSPTGSWGDPTLATRAKGKVVVAALVARIVADLRALPREGAKRPW